MALAKRVCIIGAGPAGLVAAKTLLDDHPGRFIVTIVEKSHRTGGLWPMTNPDDGMVNPNMRTNQSKHTVSFSDLAWPDRDLAWPDNISAFPKAWQVGQYLERYYEKYLKPHMDPKVDKPLLDLKLLLNTEVRHVRRSQGEYPWAVEMFGHDSTTGERQEFDHVIVASGFFGAPRMPKDESGNSLRPERDVLHSSKFRSLEDLKLSPEAKNIVIVGGQMSGVDVAAALAHQLSAEAAAPGTTGPIENRYKITHVIQKPFWVMPLTFPLDPKLEHGDSQEDNPAPDFLPLDLVSYNLDVRPAGSIMNTSGNITEDKARVTHDFMENFIGTDQSDLGTPLLALKADSSARSQPPFLGISDTYPEFVRSGNIKIVKARLKEISQDQRTVRLVTEDTELLIEDVASVILATGFEPAPSLSFLPQEILQSLEYDSTSDEFPLALNVHATVSRKVPFLGFVGFYRSPYWGVMEMQARFIANLWSGDKRAVKSLEDDQTMDEMLSLRHQPLIAQFPMGDYAYLMESLSEIVGIKRYEPHDPSERTGIVFPARYTYSTSDESTLAINAVYSAHASPRFIGRATFRAMQGNWNLDRQITSYKPTFPSGSFSGHAKFIPRDVPIICPQYDFEYLYMEDGQLVTTTGVNAKAKRNFAFRYQESKDSITAWFTPDDRKVDWFFHELQFEKIEKSWIARGSHWCSPDQYEVAYNFVFRGATLSHWGYKWVVKGPEKDYEAISMFTR